MAEQSNIRKIHYAVMRLNTDINIETQTTQVSLRRKLSNVTGYIPVFEDYQEAIKNSSGGKYEIIQLIIKK